MELNELDEAMIYFEKALEVDSNLVDARKNLENIRAESQRRNGDN